ncbi:FMRFamide receptor [Orchesella cincta]|uniref:FMRFamide receptor n=1 Tax=Orchesella cincta TaxID=48709 RepID=A0A1D2MAP5_ORCCI|nr:FMRFamide receptor [Orchesella cincta]
MCDKEMSWEVAFRESSRFWVQMVFVPIVVIIGVIGNGVAICIFRSKSMRSSTNIYLTGLAVSDLLYLLFSFSIYKKFQSIWAYWEYTPFGLWLTDCFSSTSVWLTVSFTIERYIAVCHPMKRKAYCTEKRATWISIAVYVACFVLTGSTSFEWEAVIYALKNTELGSNETYRKFYNWFATLAFFYNTATYACSFKLSTDSNETRITVLLVLVVMLFLICQLPTAVVLIYTSIPDYHPSLKEKNILLGLGNIFNLLVAVNAASNFLLYTAFSYRFRQQFREVVFHRRRSRSGRDWNTIPVEVRGRQSMPVYQMKVNYAGNGDQKAKLKLQRLQYDTHGQKKGNVITKSFKTTSFFKEQRIPPQQYILVMHWIYFIAVAVKLT